MKSEYASMISGHILRRSAVFFALTIAGAVRVAWCDIDLPSTATQADIQNALDYAAEFRATLERAYVTLYNRGELPCDGCAMVRVSSEGEIQWRT